jgi:hypothetical protein
VKDTSQFDGDVTSSDDDCLLREILEVEESVRVETKIVTGNIFRHSGSSPDGDNDSIGGVLTFLVGSSVSLVGGVGRGDGKGVLVDETSVSSDVLDLVLFDVCSRQPRSQLRTVTGRVVKCDVLFS